MRVNGISTCAVLLLQVTFVLGGGGSAPSAPSTSSNPSTQFAFEVKDGKLGELDAIDPSVTWTTSKQKGPYHLSCGVDVAVRPNTDYFSEVKGLWGRVTRSFKVPLPNPPPSFRRSGKKSKEQYSRWDVSARASVDVENYAEDPSVKLDFNSVNKEEDAAFNLKATAGNDEFSIDEIQMSKGFQALDGRLSINPRYDRTGSHVSDVIFGYDDTKSGTNVQIVASLDEQSIRVMRRVGDKDAIAPTVSTSGRVLFEWLHDLNDEGDAVITTVEPNQCVNVQWTDGPWTANVRAPLNRRIQMDQVEVSIKRKMDLSQEDISNMLFPDNDEDEEGTQSEESEVVEEAFDILSSMESESVVPEMPKKKGFGRFF
mmetsp:Transcript_10698/g.14424  ORF Transcript_10698/g.14424 Transcript_10698/m.14424 type:complete len:370 (+) Transcript_10698:120-1229(+)